MNQQTFCEECQCEVIRCEHMAHEEKLAKIAEIEAGWAAKTPLRKSIDGLCHHGAPREKCSACKLVRFLEGDDHERQEMQHYLRETYIIPELGTTTTVEYSDIDAFKIEYPNAIEIKTHGI
jgi:hypothetical protein